MSNVATKTCRQCAAEKNLVEEFGVNASAPDGRRSVCHGCRRDNRKIAASKDAQALKAHNKTVADAKRRLEQPELLTAGELKKLSDIIRLADKHREELQARVQEQHAEQERAQQLAKAGPSLKLVQQTFGSHIFLNTEQMRAKLELARVTLGNLVGADDGPAVRHVEDYIKTVSFIVQQRDDLEAEMAADAQDTLNQSVCRRVCARLMDLYLPQIRSANTAEAKITIREQIRARKKKLMVMAKTATGLDKSGAERAVVANALANALEKLALTLYSGTKAPLPTDSLENLQSRIDSGNAAQEWLEKAEADRQQYWADLKERDPKMWEKESRSLVLQIKGEGPFAAVQKKSMQQLKRDDPALYEKLALQALLPRKVTQDVIIYVVMEGKREIWYWGDGRLVKRGEEVTFDFRLRRWCLMPGPASTELEPITATGHQKMEWYQDEMDDAKWKQRPEGSGGTYEQQNDGTWKQDAGSGASPWTRPERIQFVKAEPHVEGSGKDHFAHGQWWSDEEVKAAEAADAANPPNLLPPLPRYSVSDSLALPPSTSAADRIKDAKPLETVWQRSDRLRREQAEREAALLRA